MNERLIREAAILDELIWNEYKPESGNENTKVPRDYRAFMFLETDLEIIAEALSSAFVNNLDRVFDDFRYIYEQLSGKRYNPALEAALTA